PKHHPLPLLPLLVSGPSTRAKPREQNHARAPRPLSGQASARWRVDFTTREDNEVPRCARDNRKSFGLWPVALGEFLSRLRFGLSGTSRRGWLGLACRWGFRRTC